MSKNFHRQLENKLSVQPPIAPSQAHLADTIRLSQMAYSSRRQIRHISTTQMIDSQLRFVAGPVWIFQGIVLLFLCALMQFAAIGESEEINIPALLSAFPVFIAMTALPFYGRSRKYKMRELEGSTRLSLSRLTLAKLCAVGAGDAICLGVVIIFALAKVEAPARFMLLFIVLPFLLTCAGSLFILNRAGESYGASIAAGFGIGISALYRGLAVNMPDVLIRLSTGAASLVYLFLILALVTECRRPLVFTRNLR